MKPFARFSSMAVIAVGLAMAPAFAGSVTVGHFYTQLAQAKHLGAADAAVSEASLRSAGYALPHFALDKPMTEGDVVSISTALGLTVTTSSPARPISDAQVGAFLATFGKQLGASSLGTAPPEVNGDGTGGIDPGNSGNGKGKKKGHNKSSSEPE
jgi:hypothetical protein